MLFLRETFRFRLRGRQAITVLNLQRSNRPQLAHFTRGNRQSFAFARSTKRDYFRPWLPSANSPESTFIMQISPNSRKRGLLHVRAKRYREFESLSLRHTVWVAEKLSCITARIAENRRNSVGLAFKRHRRKWLVEPHGLVSWRFSLE